MKEFIKDLVNYVIEANYQPDQDAETHRLYRINRETSPSQAPAKRAETFRKINADYKEEKRLERAPRGPQTRPRAKPVEEGVVDIHRKGVEGAKRIAGAVYQSGKEMGVEIVRTAVDVGDAIVGGDRTKKPIAGVPKIKPSGLKPIDPSAAPKPKTLPTMPRIGLDQETGRAYIGTKPGYDDTPSKRYADTPSKRYADDNEDNTTSSNGPSRRPKIGSEKRLTPSVIGTTPKPTVIGNKTKTRVIEGAEVPKGAMTGPARKPTIAPAVKTQTKAPDKKPANPFSKQDWKSRKERMDQAIDG